MTDYVNPILPDGTLQNKVIIITGASQGIGEAAAYGFALAGASVVLAARRGELVSAHAQRIRDGGGKALAIRADVTDDASCRDMVAATIAEFGRLDGALNNAGVEQTPAKLADTDLDEFDAVFAVKARGTFLSMKHEIPAMIASGGGSIVNQGSVVGVRGRSLYPAPGGSQAAVEGLTRSGAAAYAPDGIRVNMLAVGLIMTAERLVLPQTPERQEQIRRHQAMGRAGRSEEVAAVAGWLLSDYASYVTAATIPVDGGALGASV